MEVVIVVLLALILIVLMGGQDLVVGLLGCLFWCFLIVIAGAVVAFIVVWLRST